MSLTCLACRLLFSAPELHHEHYRSDWHRYNLKRRIADLPPLSKEEFEEKAAAFKVHEDSTDKRISLKCQSCNKHFASKNAMVNHVKSKKHLEVEVGLKKNTPKRQSSTAKEEIVPKQNASDEEWDDEDDDSNWESCDEDDTIVVDTNDCLFCDHQSDSSENNVSHMTETHSFFIPDIEYLTDLDGLIGFLAAKIHVGLNCLWCNGKGKGFKSVRSVKQHMIDKGHCKMLYEGDTLLDYADCYDYSNANEIEKTEDAVSVILDNPDYELMLPSGSTVGHRSLALYYKQNLKPVNSDNRKKVKKILQHYKALGYTGATGQAAVSRARDINFMQRIKNRYNLKLSLKQNKFQPHFRTQVSF